VLVIDEAGRLLLGRRAIEPRRGLWDIPGGFCGPDETPEACAVRELHEETGCTIELTGFVAHLIDTYGDDGDHTLNAVFTARIVAGTPVAADDVAELAWFALDALPPQDELAFRNTAEAISLIRQT
jgi:ADP-ribose pyrophosphatase YjhB (NUDIX family)